MSTKLDLLEDSSEVEVNESKCCSSKCCLIVFGVILMVLFIIIMVLRSKIEKFDVVLRRQINNHMKKYNIPGATFCISKNGTVLMNEGFGKKDIMNPMNASNVLRVASISKTITSVAIMILIERGVINMDDKVFGVGGLLGTKYGTAPYNHNVSLITLRDLLLHQSGFKNEPFDPVFVNHSLSHQQLFSWAIDSYFVPVKPGTEYSYSNFGYLVLGRIIEEITLMTYENFVKTTIFAPNGISDCRIGKNSLAERYEDESMYFGQDGEDPYFFNLERLDSAGGWVASSQSLVKFLRALITGKIINSTTMNTMMVTSQIQDYLGSGFMVANKVLFASGSLPGTSSFEVCSSLNGFEWAYIFNSRNVSKDYLTDVQLSMVWSTLNSPWVLWK